jgi:hypothetical protein
VGAPCGGAIAPIVASEVVMPLVSDRASMASASDMPECLDMLVLRITLSPRPALGAPCGKDSVGPRQKKCAKQSQP